MVLNFITARERRPWLWYLQFKVEQLFSYQTLTSAVWQIHAWIKDIARIYLEVIPVDAQKDGREVTVI